MLEQLKTKHDRQFEESRAQCARFSPSNIGRIDYACKPASGGRVWEGDTPSHGKDFF